jgi:hypothetical protein
MILAASKTLGPAKAKVIYLIRQESNLPQIRSVGKMAWF